MGPVDFALTERDAEEWIYNSAFARRQVGRVGVELEWLAYDARSDHDDRLSDDFARSRLAFDNAPLPSGCLISFEPGGQLELSSPPAGSLADCLEITAADLEVLRRRAYQMDVSLVGHGLDWRPPRRVVDQPRYAALEHHYGQFGGYGLIMMCNAASIQVNLDAGDGSDGWRGWAQRWWLANTLGPVLTAMFANSPAAGPPVTSSTRQVIRFQTDPTRTDPLPLDGDPRERWTAYALDALVTGVQGEEGRAWDRPRPGMTMRGWLKGRGPRPVYLSDLQRHLKSVIPPVRPCGYLELRMIDAQSGEDWVVPVAVASAVLDDGRASWEATRLARRLPPPVHRDDWTASGRHGMRDPFTAAAAQQLMTIAVGALKRLPVADWAVECVLRFAELYTERGRCPADTLLPEGTP